MRNPSCTKVETTNHEFRLWLREHRLSYSEFGRLSGYSPSTVSRWGRETMPTPEVMGDVARITEGAVMPSHWFKLLPLKSHEAEISQEQFEQLARGEKVRLRLKYIRRAIVISLAAAATSLSIAASSMPRSGNGLRIGNVMHPAGCVPTKSWLCWR